jgi:signal transduction histidine kinase
VAATGQTLMVEDAATDPRTDGRINAITASEGVRSYICVPILNGDVQVALYRLAQEAVNNVVRHSQARHAEVRLQWTPERVIVRISDDGKGFDQAAVPGGHLGIGFMRERAAALRASVEVASSPDQGTTVTIAWPA